MAGREGAPKRPRDGEAKKAPHHHHGAAKSSHGGSDAKRAKSAHGGPAKHDGKPAYRPSIDPSTMGRKERKEANRAQKAARRPNFALIQDVAGQWESLRRKDAPPAERAALAAAILQRCTGRLAKLAGSHTAARVVQACLKHGGAPARAAVWAEVEPELLPLAKSPYGRFVVSKLVTTASKVELAGILKRLRGRAAELLRHPAGAHVLDDLYAAADARQRAALAAEFFGREYALFEGGELNGLAGAPRRLADLLAAVDGAKARAVMAHLAAALAPILDKGLVDCQLAHRLLAEYMAAAPASLVAEAATALSGPALMHMAHTREGAAAACAALAHGSARDRKAAARALKGHAGALARDEWGHAVLLTALAAVDDTELLKKCVAKDLQSQLGELIRDRSGARVLLQLLRPWSSRHLPQDVVALARPPVKVHAPGPASDAAAAAAAGDDAEAPEPEGGSGSDEEEEGGEGAGASLAPGPLGVSKKDPDVRRRELLAGGLGAALAALCAAEAGALLANQHAAPVVAEVCCGGEGGLLEEVVGAPALDAVHAAVAAAAAEAAPAGAPAAGAAAASPLLEDFFGSRALRRLAVGAGAPGREGAAAGRAVNALWEGALRGRCAELAGTHAAKVLAAVALSGDSAAAAGVAAELKGAVPGGDVAAWAERLSGARRDEGGAKGGAAAKKAKANAAPAAPKGKAAPKGGKAAAAPPAAAPAPPAAAPPKKAAPAKAAAAKAAPAAKRATRSAK